VSSQARQQITELEVLGANVTTVSVDMTDSEQVNNMIATITQQGELAGVIHAAGCMDDGVLASMSWQRFAAVLAPKTLGAWNLHQACKTQPLDFLILYSSAASLLGPTAQANYAAANCFLDTLAVYRRAQGLPAMAINWGAWSTIGMAARAVNEKQLDARGMAGFAPEEGVAALAHLFKHPLEQVLVASIDWQRMLVQSEKNSFFERFSSTELSTELITDRTTELSTEFDLLERLAGLPIGEQKALITDVVKQQLVRILALASVDVVDEALGFFEMGMDSLTAVELRNALQTIVKKTLPTTLLFKYPTVVVLVDYLREDVLNDKTSNEVTTATNEEPALKVNISAQEVSDMSDDELAAMIDAELGELGEFN
jgi:acyl carrier protein/short-subunit dehydrogenase